MKRILVFLGLKVAEIGLITLMAWGIGKIWPGPWITNVFVTRYPIVFGVILLVWLVCTIWWLIFMMRENWEWAGKITRRGK